MPASPRTDSPIVPILPGRLSETASPLACIVEIPKHQMSNLRSSFTSPSTSKLEDQYTFLDSSSNTTTSSSTSSPKFSPSLPLEKFPSCLSLANLGYENDANDWTAGWNISKPRDATDITAKMRQVKPLTLPKIHQGDFNYIPSAAKVQSHWSDDESEDSIRLAKKRLARWKQHDSGGTRLKVWLRFLLKKVRFGCKR